MSKIPTAEEFKIIKYSQNIFDDSKIMIEFAKLHVNASKKEFLKYGFGRYMENIFDKYSTRVPIDEDSILNVYPLENIK